MRAGSRARQTHLTGAIGRSRSRGGRCRATADSPPLFKTHLSDLPESSGCDSNHRMVGSGRPGQIRGPRHQPTNPSCRPFPGLAGSPCRNARTKIGQGRPTLWANFWALVGVFSQIIGPRLAYLGRPCAIFITVPRKRLNGITRGSCQPCTQSTSLQNQKPLRLNSVAVATRSDDLRRVCGPRHPKPRLKGGG